MTGSREITAPCCRAPTVARSAGHAPSPLPAGNGAHLRAQSVVIPSGVALVGTGHPIFPQDGESPVKRVRLSAFRMLPTAVTNAQFREFINETGYITEAERFGWSFVFAGQVPHHLSDAPRVVGLDWWRRVDGATWRDINGPGTAASNWHADHPVVHVSWNDAQAFATWAGGRLPKEAEWEHAARGGLGDVRFPWGDDAPTDSGPYPCNIWQGQFPDQNTAADGYATTAPAWSFSPNGYGLYNMVGNVWEWCADAFRIPSLKRDARSRMRQQNGYRLAKGGSFLCHRSYCYRYRIAARIGNAPQSTTTHTGFRIVWPGEEDRKVT